MLLEDEKTFYRCYFFLPYEYIPNPVKFDKPAVIEFPYQDQLTENQKKQIAQINGMGFYLGRESGLMSLPSSEVRHLDNCSLEYDITLADDGDLEPVMELLYKCFDPLYAFLPDTEELLFNISHSQVWVMKSKNEIKAVLNSKVEKNSAIISHIAVSPSCRGCGLGKLMVDTYHHCYADRVRTFQHWVDLNNKPAMNMYTCFGYQITLRRANEYVKKLSDL